MDRGGPPEGAPVVVPDLMDLAVIDKVCAEPSWPDDNLVSSSTLCEHPKKLGSKLLFLTVEYVDEQTRDFGRIYPSFEPAAFSSRPNSPLADFKHQVSPHDPNMSSAARYSPTPVPLPSSAFGGPASREPASPLISTSESAVRIGAEYSARLHDQSSEPSTSQSDNSEDFTDSTNDDLVSSVGNELMLIQGSDLTLARDFLVMQEDQISVINSMKLGSELDSSVDQVVETILPSGDVDEERDGPAALAKEHKKTSAAEQSLQSGKSHSDWFKDEQCKDSTLWPEDCDSTCASAADCSLHGVCAIADQPVPSRAVATLPGLYLTIEKIPASDGSRHPLEFGVFAKRDIRRRTQFGPIEGILHPYSGSPINGLPLLLETKESGQFLQIDVSDENSSNWMRFVRRALSYEEQNILICQQIDKIIFLTTRNIMPNEELKAGPSLEYGKRRNLPVLEPMNNTASDSSVDNLCVEKKLKSSLFIKEENLEDNLDVENCKTDSTRLLKKRKAAPDSFQKYLEIDEDDDDSNSGDSKYFGNDNKQSFQTEKENSPVSKLELMKQEVTQSDQVDFSEKTACPVSSSVYKCAACSKRFTNKLNFQQHCLVHGIKDNESLTCNVCLKTFLNNSSLTRHSKTHQREKKDLECPVCKEAFGRVLTLKDYSATFINQEDETFTCPHCPKSFSSYALTRKHARSHHFDRKHECQFCLKCFPAADKLRMHLLKHSDRREFQCANCGKQFKRKDKLKDHVTRVHYTPKNNKDQVSSNNRAKKIIPKINPVDCDRFIYKCRRCQVGFKRRGMLVNHLAKRHPDVPPESVPELSLPILRQTRDYYCQYCDKVYKSSSKRKAHIMKNHPGAALPPSNRNKDYDIPGLPNPTFSQAAGSIKTIPQSCPWCHKQYASKAKLLQHQRKKHSSLMEPADQIPRPRSRPPQNLNSPSSSSNSSGQPKPRAARVSSSSNSSNSSSSSSSAESPAVDGDFEPLAGAQFARVRDMR